MNFIVGVVAFIAALAFICSVLGSFNLRFKESEREQQRQCFHSTQDKNCFPQLRSKE